MAWGFQGNTDNDFVTLADAAALTLPDGDWTIAGWFFWESVNGDTFQYIISTGGFGVASTINLYVARNDGAIPGAMGISFNDAGGDAFWGNPATANGTLTINVWNHIVVERSGNRCDIYVDNVTKFNETDAAVNEIDSGNDMNIGRRQDATRHIDGSLAEWAKWDRALSSEERAFLVAGGLPIAIPEDLKWYLPMHGYHEAMGGLTVTNNGTDIVEHAPVTNPLHAIMMPCSSSGVIHQGIGTVAATAITSGAARVYHKAIGAVSAVATAIGLARVVHGAIGVASALAGALGIARVTHRAIGIMEAEATLSGTPLKAATRLIGVNQISGGGWNR